MPDKKDAAAPQNTENEIAKDWESAFQAGDYLFSETPDESIPAVDGRAAGGRPRKGGKDGLLDKTAIKSSAKGAVGWLSRFFIFPLHYIAKVARVSFSLPLQLIPSSLRSRLGVLPQYAIALVGWISVAVALGYTFSYYDQHDKDKVATPLPQMQIEHAKVEEETKGVEVIGSAVPARITEGKNEETVQHPVLESPSGEKTSLVEKEKDEIGGPLPAQGGGKKVRWPFGSFFFTVEQQGAKEPLFVEVEVTLVALLAPEGLLPDDRTVFLRDSIYQFFVNQKADDLRRYTMNRGALRNSLSQWVHRMWPEGAVAGVIIDKYQVL